MTHAPFMNRWLPAALIVVLLAGFRILGSVYSDTLPNLQPLPALLLCSLVFLHGIQRWLLPLLCWLVTDPLTSLAQGYPAFGVHNFSVAFGILVIFGISLWTRRHPRTFPVLASAAASALAFHFLTGMISFAFDPLYPKTWNGLLQAQWTGPEGYAPTWIFLRNLLAANVLFSGLFLAARSGLPRASADSLPLHAR